MEPPPGYEQEGTVWLLQMGLYGLKEAGRIWNKELKADMEELGFVQCQWDHAIFCHSKWGSPDWAVWAIWVDDETGVGSCQQPDHVASMFNQKY